MGLGGTMFPQMIGLASTWMPDLAERMTAEIRAQLRSTGAHEGLAPVLDVARDPRWGRVEETFGEDPLLVSQFGVAYVRGLKGTSLKDGGVMATGKHFVGHSFSQGGMNCAPTRMGVHDLWDIFLMPFQAAIDAGIDTMMNAYPELDGVVVAASRRILTDMLRGQLGFDGLVVSDYEAVQMINSYHNQAADMCEAAVLALTAGIDVELPTVNCYNSPLKAAIESGEVDLAMIDTAVRRHLQKKFELGLFENPFVDEGHVVEVFETPAQRSLAREIARKSMVLLKNDGLLPLSKDIRTLAVIGPNADDSRSLLGDYSYAAVFELFSTVNKPKSSTFDNVDPVYFEKNSVRVPSVLSAMCVNQPGTRILYARGCDHSGDDTSGFDEAVKLARQADAVVLVLGDRSGLTPDCTMGETRDSADLLLAGVQEQLAEAVFATGKPTVVVLVTGRPYAINMLAEKATAILAAGIPGEEGGAAISETLFGQNNPGGRLSMSYPRHVGQLPLFYNQKPSGGKSNWYWDYTTVESSPLYAFGHGLSYTRFAYSQFKLSATQVKAGDVLDIHVTVANTGSMAGDEVVQLYICDEYGCIPRPVKELKGFTRIPLRPGESRRVTFHLPVDMLAFYDEDLQLMVERGTFKVMVGASSADIRCEGMFEVTGEKKSLVKERLFACPVEVV
jgi:beta-glucosidase